MQNIFASEQHIVDTWHFFPIAFPNLRFIPPWLLFIRELFIRELTNSLGQRSRNVHQRELNAVDGLFCRTFRASAAGNCQTTDRFVLKGARRLSDSKGCVVDGLFDQGFRTQAQRRGVTVE